MEPVGFHPVPHLCQTLRNRGSGSCPLRRSAAEQPDCPFSGHTEQEQLKTWNPTPESFQEGAMPTSKCQPSHTEVRERVILMKLVLRSSAEILSPAGLAPADVGSMAPACFWASYELNIAVLSQSEAQAALSQTREIYCVGFSQEML